MGLDWGWFGVRLSWFGLDWVRDRDGLDCGMSWLGWPGLSWVGLGWVGGLGLVWVAWCWSRVGLG